MQGQFLAIGTRAASRWVKTKARLVIRQTTECSMLVLSRKAREQIQIGDEVVVTILQVKGQSVRIGIEAPKNVRVLRSELPRHETAAAAEPGEERPKTKTKTRSARATLRSAHPGENIDGHGSSPLASRLDARRSPRLSIPESMRSSQRMEVSMVRFDAAVRSTSLSG
jgi:carbon storage regulator CsrA